MRTGKTPGKGGIVTPAVALFCFVIDVISKQWARTHLVSGITQQLIPGIIQLTLTANTGAAFSLGSGNAILMSSLATVMTLALIAWSIKRELTESSVPLIDRIGMGCLLGGAFGNLFDRLARGRVTDFLEFGFVSFPVFNAADALIDVGIGLLILSSMQRPQSDKAAQSPQPGRKDEGIASEQNNKGADADGETKND